MIVNEICAEKIVDRQLVELCKYFGPISVANLEMQANLTQYFNWVSGQ